MAKYIDSTKEVLRYRINFCEIQKFFDINEEFVKEFELKVKKTSNNKEVIIFTASWGMFSLDIKVLNFRKENTKHEYSAA